MNPPLEALQAGGSRFHSTRWSIVAACRGDDEAGRKALEQLCLDYWSPIYGYLRWQGQAPAEAQELTQAFFAWLVESEAYARADRSRGKFRTFLLALLQHFFSSARRKAECQKRGGEAQFIPLEKFDDYEEGRGAALSIEGPRDEERDFERQWAGALVERALEAVAAEYLAAGKARIFEELLPFLQGGVHLPTHADAAARLQVLPKTLRSHLTRLRTSYRRHLRAEVSRTIARDTDVEDELRYLCRVLIASA